MKILIFIIQKIKNENGTLFLYNFYSLLIYSYILLSSKNRFIKLLSFESYFKFIYNEKSNSNSVRFIRH